MAQVFFLSTPKVRQVIGQTFLTQNTDAHVYASTTRELRAFARVFRRKSEEREAVSLDGHHHQSARQRLAANNRRKRRGDEEFSRLRDHQREVIRDMGDFASGEVRTRDGDARSRWIFHFSSFFARSFFLRFGWNARADIRPRCRDVSSQRRRDKRDINFPIAIVSRRSRVDNRAFALSAGAFAADSRSIASMLTSLSLSSFSLKQLMGLLKPTDKNWQPQDFLPDPESEEFLDNIKEIQKRAEGVSDDLMVVLVGDMITEEALPTYMNMLNTLDETKDITGADGTPWAQWTRKWTAEENRHGDLMNKYMWMTGKCNMKPIETTIQNLIGSGMNPQTDNNPYLGFVYTSFQERATKISHGTHRKNGVGGWRR